MLVFPDIPSEESHSPPSSIDLLTLSKRNAEDNFTKFVERVTKATRAITGIFLQNGIIDGSITLDKLTPELLNLGVGMSMTEFSNYSTKPIDDFADKLKEVFDGLISHTVAYEAEFTAMQKLKEGWINIGDLTKIPAETDFYKLDATASSVTSKVDTFALKDSINALRKAVLTPADADQTALTATKTSLDAIVLELNAFKTAVNIDEVEAFLKQLSPFANYIHLVETNRNNKTNGAVRTAKPNKIQKITESVKTLEELAGLPKVDISRIEAILVNRLRFSHPKRELTAGLIEGYVDLAMMFTDCKDKWVKEVFGEKIDLVALEQMADLRKKIEEVDNKLNTAIKTEMLRTVEDIKEIQALLTSVQPASSDVDKAFAAFKPFDLTNIGKEFMEFLEIKNNIIGFERKLKAIKNVSTELTSEQIANFAALDDKTNTADIKKVLDLLEKLAGFFKILKEEKSIQEMATNLSNNKTLLTGFDATVDPHVDQINYLKDLQASDPVTSKVAQAINIVIKMRKLKKNAGLLDDVKALKTIFNVSKEFDEVKNWTLPTNQTNDNPLLKSLKPHVTQFGEASTAAIMISKTLERKADFDGLIRSDELVTTAIEKVQDKVKAKKITKKWGNLVETALILNATMTMLEGKKASVSSEVKGITALGTTFDSLKGLTDTVLDVRNRVEALDLLLESINEQATKDKITTLKEQLMRLAPLDLELSKFNQALTLMPANLEFIRNAMADVKTTTHSPEPYIKPVMHSQQGATKNEEQLVFKWDRFYNDLGYLLAIFVYAIIVINCCGNNRRR